MQKDGLCKNMFLHTDTLSLTNLFPPFVFPLISFLMFIDCANNEILLTVLKGLGFIQNLAVIFL